MNDAPASSTVQTTNGATPNGASSKAKSSQIVRQVAYAAHDGREHYELLRQSEAFKRELEKEAPPHFMVEVRLQEGLSRRRGLQVLFDSGLLYGSSHVEGYVVPERTLQILDHFEIEYEVGQRFGPDEWS